MLLLLCINVTIFVFRSIKTTVLSDILVYNDKIIFTAVAPGHVLVPQIILKWSRFINIWAISCIASKGWSSNILELLTISMSSFLSLLLICLYMHINITFIDKEITIFSNSLYIQFFKLSRLRGRRLEVIYILVKSTNNISGLTNLIVSFNHYVF